MNKIAKPGTTVWLPFSTKNASGTLVNADSLPTVSLVTVNGTATTVTTTVTQVQDAVPANVTGEYQVEVDGASFNDGDEISIHLAATISGTAVSLVKSISVYDAGLGSPYIE